MSEVTEQSVRFQTALSPVKFIQASSVLALSEDEIAPSDFVSLPAPLYSDTRHLINAQRLAQFTPGAFLLNCARGPLVDTYALMVARESGHIAGAALDVTEPEPLPGDHPILK